MLMFINRVNCIYWPASSIDDPCDGKRLFALRGLKILHYQAT